MNSKMIGAFWSLVCASGVGCNDALNTPLVSDERLAYLADALELGSQAKLGDLFGNPKFTKAPNPAQLLEKMQKMNPPAAADSIPLSFVSLNLGLLRAHLFSTAITVVEAPDVDERTPAVLDSVLNGENDVVFVQELWTREAQAYAERAAAARGYRVAGHVEPNDVLTGLYTFIRAELIDDFYIDSEQVDFTGEAADPFTLFVSVVRGFQVVSFTHPELGDIRLYNTHFAPFPNGWRQRLHEQLQLGEHMSMMSESGLVFAGGDFNAGPYYANETWTNADGNDVADWFANALSYPVGLFLGGLDDLFIRGRPQQLAALDVSAGLSVLNQWEDARQTPFGAWGWCEKHSHDFSATDCNSLYFQQYAGQEAPARMDHLLVRDPQSRVHATNSHIAFDQMQLATGDVVPVSDHGAIRVDVKVAPARW
jgi:endonuclease/exonuclease/phosphatase family metal-dependent hydrolase